MTRLEEIQAIIDKYDLKQKRQVYASDLSEVLPV